MKCHDVTVQDLDLEEEVGEDIVPDDAIGNTESQEVKDVVADIVFLTDAERDSVIRMARGIEGTSTG